MRAGGDVGPANADRFVVSMCQPDDFERIELLRKHCGGEDEVGPVEMLGL
jgi:hypothetical protein